MERGIRPSTEVNVALQGTIETFALPDVMRLLASTKKTGCLRLDGDRGTGEIYLDDGRIIGSETSVARHAGDAVEVVFELLRFGDGRFVFDAGVSASEPSAPVEVETVIEEAEKIFEEWKGIEAVVPSLDAWVGLAPELGSDEVTVSGERWKLLVAIGAGTTVGQLGNLLELGELPVSRKVKELVEAGLVVLEQPPVGADETAEAPFEASTFLGGHEETESAGGLEPGGLEPGLFEESEDYEPFDSDSLRVDRGEEFPTLPGPTVVGAAAPTGLLDANPTDAAEIARQLANLSPKAAKAVAAAAKATTEEEREAALAEVDDEDDPINRDLLIKFLGSVNG
jgi:hypothetical protein